MWVHLIFSLVVLVGFLGKSFSLDWSYEQSIVSHFLFENRMLVPINSNKNVIVILQGASDNFLTSLNFDDFFSCITKYPGFVLIKAK